MPEPNIPLGGIPRLLLGEWPTPVVSLSRLGAALGQRALWLKRDDRSSPRYGGTKVRALEFLLPRAIERGHALLFGGLGSTYAVAAAVHGRALGVEIAVVQFPQSVTPTVEEHLCALRAVGARLYAAPRRTALPWTLARAWLAEHRRHRTAPAWLPPGGASPAGCLGYLLGFAELVDQVSAGLLPKPDLIVLPLGSGGTLAALTMGARWLGWRTRVAGVRIADAVIANRFRVAALARRLAHLLERRGAAGVPHLSARDVEVWGGYVGKGYGEPTAESERASALAADLEGLALDPTYTGKTMAALVDRGAALGGEVRNVVFWNTFSSPPLGTLPINAQPTPSLP